MLAAAAIALAMSTDAFAAALGKGAALDRPRLAEALRTGLVFGSVEALTPLLGWACGLAASAAVQTFDHWIAFALLGALGLRMIRASLDKAATRPARHSLATLGLTAIGTSMDAFVVGATLALIEADIVVVALAIGLATFTMATLGVMIGRLVGPCLGRAAEAAGGIVLIAVGTGILVQHLGLIGA